MPEAWDQLGNLVLESLKSLRTDIQEHGRKFDNFVFENGKDARDLALKTGRLEDRMARLEANTSQSSGVKTVIVSSIISSIASGTLIVILLKGLGIK